MEVSERQSLASDHRVSSNSFECDSTTWDAILGLKSIGQRRLRMDKPESGPKSPVGKQPAQVYAPLEVVPAASSSIAHASNSSDYHLLADKEFQRERLVRLLDRQQAWYDAHQQAARAAEQLLSLCEHHQQQWLLPNQPTLTSPPART